MKRTNYTSYQGKNGSQFWKGINKLKNKFLWGASFVIKNGKKIKFWEDIWLGEVPIKVLHPDFYLMCSQPQARVIDYWDGSDWSIAFRRSLSISEKQDLDDLILLLNQIDLVDGNDNVLWDLEKSKVFSTKSLYSFITNRGVTLQNSGSF